MEAFWEPTSALGTNMKPFWEPTSVQAFVFLNCLSTQTESQIDPKVVFSSFGTCLVGSGSGCLLVDLWKQNYKMLGPKLTPILGCDSISKMKPN